MNRPISNDASSDDDEIRGWISEAGDARIQPRPEHVDQLRGLLLDRLGPPRLAMSGRRRRLARWLVAACILMTAGLAGFFGTLGRPTNAWARVAQALQEKPWIHIVNRGQGAPMSETWISPRFQIVASKYDHGPEYRGAEYVDLKTGIKAKYVAGENTIYRLPEPGALQKHDVHGLIFAEQLLRGEIFKISPIPDTEIVGQKSRDVVEQGKSWKECEVTVRSKGSPELKLRMWLRVDPTTGLPRIWDVETIDGKIQQTIDYPASGPADILALGAPATAKWVDRIPSNDLNRVLTGLKIGRNRFDDYCGYIWSEGTINRVWRKGRKLRVEDVHLRLPTRATLPEFARPPDNVDLAWYKRREKDLIFDPQAIFDGQTVWYYHYKPEPVVPDKPLSLKLESVTSQPVYGSSDDPDMPWPHLMPEQLGHPSVYVPTNDREFLLDNEPEDGPPNIVRLRVRNARSNDPMRPDLYRLWVDPERNYLAIKAQTSVFEAGNIQSKIAYIDTKVLADFARSPSGFWYPTRVVRTTSESNYVQVTRFLLDFQAEIPDELFRHRK